VVPENVDSSDNIPELTADPIPNENVDTNVVSLPQKHNVQSVDYEKMFAFLLITSFHQKKKIYNILTIIIDHAYL
jgi:16S rRNA A1518/A1519 N6-dimethyltransferase RsmA/KsgA/DIM1 with predicted DNA glycosylase/AP lyase activity